MRCPHCESENTRVIDTTHDAKGGIRRRRVCEDCDQRFSTYERAVLSTPLIIKRDNTREEFDKEKLLQGIRLACTKRPVSAEEIERLAGEIEAKLQHTSKLEIPSQVIGDFVIEGLRKLDDVAYIRFASVYLPLGNLNALRDEIDRLLEHKGENA
jgi:transcriptional repressor NrdR